MAERVFAVPLVAGLDAPNLQLALSGDVALVILDAWRTLASDSLDQGDYAAHLTLASALRYPFMGNADAVAVINTADHARFVDEGRAGFHLPSSWGKGAGRWLVGKDGHRYARVPFRIESPTGEGGGRTRGHIRRSMPNRVYSFARKLEPRQRLSWTPNEYRLSRHYRQMAQQGLDVPQRLVDVGGYTWKASQFDGLFVAEMQRTENAPRHATYMTVRTITPESDGWYIPPTPAHHYNERALAAVSGEVQRILDAAAARDIEQAFDRAAGELL